MLTYMANCGANTTCDQFNITEAKWFKVQQVGRTADGSAWVQADLSKLSLLFFQFSDF